MTWKEIINKMLSHVQGEEKCQITLSNELVIGLTKIAERNELTLTELVRKFIKLGIIVEQNEYKGGRTLLESKDKPTISMRIHNTEVENLANQYLTDIINKVMRDGK